MSSDTSVRRIKESELAQLSYAREKKVAGNEVAIELYRSLCIFLRNGATCYLIFNRKFGLMNSRSLIEARSQTRTKKNL